MSSGQIIVANSGLIQLEGILDGEDGTLFVIEQKKTVPFKIKRIYYIKNLSKNISMRGAHAHKEIEQVIFCINGSFNLHLDDGVYKQDLKMCNDNIGIMLGKELWHEMSQFSEDCILLVIASDYYYESDYIRKYDDFLKYIGQCR